MQEALAASLHNAGLVSRLLGDWAEALPALASSIQIRQKLLLSYPDNKQLQQALTETLRNLAELS